jgi:hypothetical protein
VARKEDSVFGAPGQGMLQGRELALGVEIREFIMAL